MLAAAAVFLEQGLEQDWCDARAPGELGMTGRDCLLPSKTPQEDAGMEAPNMLEFRGCLAPAPELFAATGHELMVTGSRIINHILVFSGLFLGHHLSVGLPHLEHGGDIKDGILDPRLVLQAG